MLTRRMALTGAAASGLAWSVAAGRRAVAAPAETFPVMHSDAGWRHLLTPAQYAVLRQSATERPFTSPLLDEHRAGIFACAGCTRGLFSSETKFESGTGWPSFWAPLNNRRRHRTGYLAGHDPNRGALRRLRRSCRPCVQRRPAGDRLALLHERRRDDVQARGRLAETTPDMTLLLLAYLGGVLTIVSPCILPVLPFVFARSDRPFVGSGLPMLIGMAVTFAAVATLAAVGGGWAVQANEYGRLRGDRVVGAVRR